MKPKEAEEKLKSLIEEINKEGLVILTSVLDQDRGDYSFEEVTPDGLSVIERDNRPFGEEDDKRD